MTSTTTRPLSVIAAEIRKEWPAPWYGAIPYLEAMECLTGIEDPYGLEDGRGIVLYFLSNAKTWKGEAARRIKAELRAMV